MRFEALLLAGLVLAPSGVDDSVTSDATPAASTDWSIFRGSPSLHGIAQGRIPAQPELLWTFEAEGPIASSPVVADGRVFFGSDDAKVRAVDAKTGEELWAFETQDIVEAPPLVAGGLVFIGGHDFFLYAIDAKTGELRWKKELDDKLLGSANWFRGAEGKLRIVVGCYDTHLYCFDAESGDEVWRYKTDNYVNGTPAVAGDRIVFGGCDAGLHVVSASTGEKLTKIELGDACHVAGSVAIVDGRVYLGHYGNAFDCVDIESGEVLWSFQNPRHAFFSSPSVTEDRVVFGGRDRKLHCVNKDTGEELWAFKTRRKVDGSPVVCGDRVVFGSADGRLYILDLADGKELWNFEAGRSILASPAVHDGRIYIGANDGRLYAFGPAEEVAEGESK